MKKYNKLQRSLLLFILVIIQLLGIELYGQVPLRYEATTSGNTALAKGPTPRALGDGPGGVSLGLRVWLRADDPNAFEFLQAGGVNTDQVETWYDQSGLDNHYYYLGLDGSPAQIKSYERPVYKEYEEKMNFHPSVYFSLDAFLGTYFPDRMLGTAKPGPMSVDSPENFTTFVSYYSDKLGAKDVRLYTHGFGGNHPTTSATRKPAIGFTPKYNSGRMRYSEGYSVSDGTIQGYTNNSTALEMVNIQKSNGSKNSGYVIYDFGGYQEKLVNSNSDFGTKGEMTKGGTLGGASIADGKYSGLISDVIFYERTLTDEEQRKVITYMGIKYGLTLDKDLTNENVNYDYILSSGTNVWKGNSSPNKGYHHSVAGIVRDDESLFVNKSKSTAREGVVGMMPQSHTEKGQGSSHNPSFVNDQSGLFWGDNNSNNFVATVSGDECFPFTTRTTRTWLVQKTNLNKMPVTIFVGASGSDKLDAYMTNGYQAYLLVAKTQADIDNKTWDLVIPGKFDTSDKYHKFDYTFTEEYTYFSIGFRELPGNCTVCQFDDLDGISFTNAANSLGKKSFVVKSTSSPINKTGLTSNGGNLTVNAKFEITSGVKKMTIRPGTNRAPLTLTSRGNTDNIVSGTSLSRVTFTLSKAADVFFKIGNIDRAEGVKVYGYCNGNKVLANNVYMQALSGADKKKGYTFTYKGRGIAEGNGLKLSGKLSPRGILNVDFGFSVDQVVVEYTSSKATSRTIEIYPMEFSCPQAMPEPNEQGYAMQKRGSKSVNVCDIVNYSFIILNANGNCDSTRMRFEDTLPNDMMWLPNSLSLDNALLDNKVEDKGGQSIIMNDNKLVIDSLKIPGNGTQVTFRAQAVFKDDAPINQTYYNQSFITYLRKDNKLAETLESTDAFFKKDVDTEKRTPTFVENDARDYKYLSAEMTTKPSDCFRETNEIEVTIKVYNPNNAIPQMYLVTDYNENFKYVPGSFKVNGVTDPMATEQVEVDDDNDAEPGFTTIYGFTLPGNTSSNPTIITYKIKAPILGDLEFDTDASGKKTYYPFIYGYDLNTEVDDGPCLANAFLFTQGDGEIPYCLSLKYVITNKNTTTKGNKK